jgi:hypothetical protein
MKAWIIQCSIAQARDPRLAMESRSKQPWWGFQRLRSMMTWLDFSSSIRGLISVIQACQLVLVSFPRVEPQFYHCFDAIIYFAALRLSGFVKRSDTIPRKIIHQASKLGRRARRTPPRSYQSLAQ